MLDPLLRTDGTPRPGSNPSVKKRDRLWHNLSPLGAEKDMEHLRSEADKYNIKYSFDGALTNTRDSLRLVLWAQACYGRNEELMTALGARHFGQDERMADHKVLLDAVRDIGLDADEAAGSARRR